MLGPGGGPDGASDRVAPNPNFHPLAGRDQAVESDQPNHCEAIMIFFNKVKRLCKLAAKSADTGDLELAVQAVIQEGGEDAVRTLLRILNKALGGRQWSGRIFILPSSLAKLGDIAIGPIAQLLDRNSTSPVLQGVLVDAMRFIASPRPEAIHALTNALGRGPNEYGGHSMAESAARALAAVGPAAMPAIPSLVRNLAIPDKHPRSEVCDAAEDALKQIGPEVAPHVITLLSDPDRQSRAVRILEYVDVRDPTLFDQLLRIWNQPDAKTPALLRYMARTCPSRASGILREAIASEQLTEGQYYQKMYLDAAAAEVIAEWNLTNPPLAKDLPEPIAASVNRIVADLEVEIRKAPDDYGIGLILVEDRGLYRRLSHRILRLAFYRQLARPAARRIRAIADATKSVMISIWLAALLACIAEDPRPHIRRLCRIMREADAGHGAGLDGAIGYMGDWAAGGPAMAAQDSLDQVAAIMGREIVPVLKELRNEYATRIDKCLDTIEKRSIKPVPTH